MSNLEKTHFTVDITILQDAPPNVVVTSKLSSEQNNLIADKIRMKYLKEVTND